MMETHGDDLIDVLHIGHDYLVFSKNAAKLVEKYRICGAYIGSLVRCPLQNQILGLPLRLSTEEALRLFEIASPNEVRFFDWTLEQSRHLLNSPIAEQCEKYAALREVSYTSQIELFRNEKIQNVMIHRDSIQHGAVKRRQRRENALMATVAKAAEADRMQQSNTNTDPNVTTAVRADTAPETHSSSSTATKIPQDSSADEALQELLSKASKRIERADSLIEIPLQTNSLLQRSNERLTACSHLSVPAVMDRDIDRFCVYRYFHERGYYLTHATKFGGDFLVYANQPGTCHSSFVVHCVSRDTRLPSRSLSNNSRLANAVHKLTVYCYVSRPVLHARSTGGRGVGLVGSTKWWHLVRQSVVQSVSVSWTQVDPDKEKEVAPSTAAGTSYSEAEMR